MRARYLKLALCAVEAALRGEDGRTYLLGAAAIRGDGAIVTATNGPAPKPTKEAHAEYRLARKLDRKATVLVVRVKRDGSYGCALPCASCRYILALAEVAKVYYTTGESDLISRLW